MGKVSGVDMKSDPYAKYVIKTDIKFKPLEKITADRIIHDCPHDWFNQTLCKLNNSVVRLGIFKGEFHFHKHDNEDEFFFVLDGTFFVDYENKTIELKRHQGIVVPKGVVHRTRATKKAVVLMVELDSVTATGD
ncbi:Cupin 2 conserved barrel domain protein [Candidatus Zixiibacteriota bacterium]|nr:Cupin 2 conserved barrel domain protein [candidate division Zixibacteria bacterium]